MASRPDPNAPPALLLLSRFITALREHPPLVLFFLGVLVCIAMLLLVLVAGAYLVLNSQQPPPAGPGPSPPGVPSTAPEREGPAESSVHLVMGNPGRATADEANRDNYLMRKRYFALSYNNAKGTPNWVSWCLQKSDLGSAPRAEFYPDPDLPPSFKHVKPSDYSGSGFDRGHMCPHSDRGGSEEASQATFVMTNIIPQSPACNQRAWADLEDYCRSLVRQKRQTLYIVSGPQGEGGQGTKGQRDVIGRAEKVTVPAQCWKVVLALGDGRGDAGDVNRVSRSSRVFAVVMPNDQSVGHGWAKYRTSAADVEKLTGYTFFDRVPADIIGPLKERVDHEHIPPSRHGEGDD